MRVISTEQCPKCAFKGGDSRGDNLALYGDGHKWCYACHYLVPAPFYNIFKPKEDHGSKSTLPSDFTRDIPAAAWKWLLQYGLSYDYWKPHCGYSPSSSRLVFTVGDAFSIGRYIPQSLLGELRDSGGSVRVPVFQQSGGLPVQRTKIKKWYVWGDPHKHAEIIGQGEATVLVEDLISGHKVGQVTETIPLFGTMVHTPVLYHLINTNKPVKLWLDNDQRGNVQKTATRLQTIIGRPVDIISTVSDPKCLDYDEIKKVLYANPI